MLPDDRWLIILCLDHITSKPDFEAQLKADALSFRPFGKKVGEYSRPTGKTLERKKSEKGNKRKFVDPDEEDGETGTTDADERNDVVTYELWKVSSRLAFYLFGRV